MKKKERKKGVKSLYYLENFPFISVLHTFSKRTNALITKGIYSFIYDSTFNNLTTSHITS